MRAEPEPLVEHFFRHESANLVSVLTRAFGFRRIELIEDMVQSAILEAMHAWKQHGAPKQPAAWIHRVAKNKILDSLRREKVHQRAMALSGNSPEHTEPLLDEWLGEDRLPDSLLRMMFVCCHPTLDRTSQIALTLNILCGFSVREIASGLLVPPETTKKKVQRAKKSLSDLAITLELPQEEEIAARLDTIHDVLYLMFNEGYSTSKGDDPIRDDLCEDAARLCHFLCTRTDYATPTTRALLALMLLHAARLDSRRDARGATVLLEDQDRTTWDAGLICEGGKWLQRGSSGTVSRFHLEAAIALVHCQATEIAATDWSAIVGLYDLLVKRFPSPIYVLNRAIALGETGEIERGLRELESIRSERTMEDYVLLDCASAKLFERRGDVQSAAACYKKALARTRVEHERTLIQRRLAALQDV